MRELAHILATAYATKQAGLDPASLLDQAKQFGGQAVEAAKSHPTLAGAAAGGAAGFASGKGLRQRLRRFLGGAALGGAAGFGAGQVASAVKGPGDAPAPAGKYSFPGGAISPDKLKAARGGEAFKTYAAKPDEGLLAYANPATAMGAAAAGAYEGAQAAPATAIGAGVSAARSLGSKGNRMNPEAVGEGGLYGHGASALAKDATHGKLSQFVAGMDASHRQRFSEAVRDAVANKQEYVNFMDGAGKQVRVNVADASQIARSGVKGMLGLGEKDKVPGRVRQEWNGAANARNVYEKAKARVTGGKAPAARPVTRPSTLTAKRNFGRNLAPLAVGAGIDLASYGLGARGSEAVRRQALSKLREQTATE